MHKYQYRIFTSCAIFFALFFLRCTAARSCAAAGNQSPSNETARTRIEPVELPDDGDEVRDLRARASFEAGWEALAAGQYRKASRLFEDMLDALRPFREGDVLVSAGQESLARTLMLLGEYGQARSQAESALMTRERSQGPNHREIIPVLRLLALIRCNQGDYAPSLHLLRRALSICNRTAAGPAEEGLIYAGLGDTSCELARYGEAEAYYRRSLTLLETVKARPGCDSCIAEVTCSLADSLCFMGRHAEAEGLYRRALAIAEKSLPANHPWLAQQLNGLASACVQLSKYAEAEALLRRSLSIQNEALGPEHVAIASTLEDLADVYQCQGKLNSAEALHQKALAIRKRVQSPDHPAVANNMRRLADVYLAQGKPDEARSLYLRAIAIQEKALPADHEQFAYSLVGLADTETESEHFVRAETLYQRALAAHEKVQDASHPVVRRILRHYASSLYRAGRIADARKLEERASGGNQRGQEP